MAELVMTVFEMQNREKWLAARDAGIGGSDAAVIVGLSKWKSPFQLWLEKTGQVEPEDISDNEYVHFGNILEQVVADEFTLRTGKKVQRRGLMRDSNLPFMLASVDRMVIGENAGLECKTANGFAAKEWEGDEIPDAYYCQCQHYMAVTGCEKWYIAVLIGGNHFVWKEVWRNEDDITALITAEIEFWHKVQDNIMPAVDGSESCTTALKEKFRGGQIEPVTLESEAADILTSLDELNASKNDIEATISMRKNRLCEMLGNNEIGYAGDRKITWKPQAGKTTVDSKRLKAELPDIYAKYSNIGKPTRVLRI